MKFGAMGGVTRGSTLSLAVAWSPWAQFSKVCHSRLLFVVTPLERVQCDVGSAITLILLSIEEEVEEEEGGDKETPAGPAAPKRTQSTQRGTGEAGASVLTSAYTTAEKKGKRKERGAHCKERGGVDTQLFQLFPCF